MITRFGSVSALLSVDPEPPGDQERGHPRADAMLKACRDLMHHALRERIGARPILATREALYDYLSLTLANLRFEELHVLFLTNGHRLIADELMWRGTVDQVAAYPREVVRRALLLGAKSLVVVHNHPSGDPKPSTEDKALTAAIGRACCAMDIDLLDHVIVARGGIASFRELKLL